MRRRIISVKTIVGTDGDEHVLALCDDSSVWVHDEGENAWYRLADIPQSLESDDEAPPV